MVRLLPWKKKESQPSQPLPRWLLMVGFVVILLLGLWFTIVSPVQKPLPVVTPTIEPAPSFSGM